MSGRIRPHPEVLVQELPDGDAVLLHMETEVYFSLDQVGTRMWNALAETGDVELAAAELVEVYEVDDERLRSDLNDLVDRLTEQGLLEVSDE